MALTFKGYKRREKRRRRGRKRKRAMVTTKRKKKRRKRWRRRRNRDPLFSKKPGNKSFGCVGYMVSIRDCSTLPP